MNSPKIQLLPQGFATRDAQGAKIPKVLEMKKNRNAKITQKCGIMKSNDSAKQFRNLRNSSKSLRNAEL